MPSVSLPVTRPTGRALLVGSVDCRQRPLALLQEIGYICVEADDPYSAAVELSRSPHTYRAVILSLASIFREELLAIGTIKGRFPQVEVWLTDTDGRQASLADAMRLGADGLLGNDGLHRIAIAAPHVAPHEAEHGSNGANGSNGSKRQHRKAARSRRSRGHRGKDDGTAQPHPPDYAAAPLPPAPRKPGVSPIAPAISDHGPQQAPRHGRRDDAAPAAREQSRSDIDDDLDPGSDAVLTAEELRALLQENEQPANESGRK